MDAGSSGVTGVNSQAMSLKDKASSQYHASEDDPDHSTSAAEMQQLTVAARRSIEFSREYPLIGRATKIIPQCAIVIRGGFENLVGEDGGCLDSELTAQQRLVPCPMACGEEVVDWQVDHHKAKVCRKRNTQCELKCGVSLRYKRRF